MSDQIEHRLNTHASHIESLKLDMTRLDANVKSIDSNVTKIADAINSIHKDIKPKSTDWTLIIAALTFIFGVCGSVIVWNTSIINDKLHILDNKIVQQYQISKELDQKINDHKIEYYQQQIDHLKSKQQMQ